MPKTVRNAHGLLSSPSTRRAWIEIAAAQRRAAAFAVALHPEGVDRNEHQRLDNPVDKRSPSTRRAWIEIQGSQGRLGRKAESPSTRRAWIEMG